MVFSLRENTPGQNYSTVTNWVISTNFVSVIKYLEYNLDISVANVKFKPIFNNLEKYLDISLKN